MEDRVNREEDPKRKVNLIKKQFTKMMGDEDEESYYIEEGEGEGGEKKEEFF